MALPLAPIAVTALRYGAVALIGAAIAHNRVKAREGKDPTREASYDSVPDGVDVGRVTNPDETQYEASHGHWQRIWLGRDGVEFDSRILARLRMRRIQR